MSEELFQRLLSRLTKEHEDAKEAAAKQAEANRIAAEAAAALAAEKAKVEAEAQRLRQIVLDNERKEREAQEAAEAKEAAAREAKALRIAAEEKRVARLRARLSSLSALSKTVLNDSWVQQVHEIECRLAEAEASDWAEFDMEAEGYIAITREWLAVAAPAAQAAAEAEIKALAEAEAKRKAELAPDVEKLSELDGKISAFLLSLADVADRLKSAELRDSVLIFCRKADDARIELDNNVAALAE
jgi:hypothetical protein